MALKADRRQTLGPSDAYVVSAQDGDRDIPVTIASPSDTSHFTRNRRHNDDDRFFFTALAAQLRQHHLKARVDGKTIHVFPADAKRTAHRHPSSHRHPLHNAAVRASQEISTHRARSDRHHSRRRGISREMIANADVLLAHLAKNKNQGMNFHPEFANKVLRVAQILSDQGYEFVISSGVRSKTEQRHLRSRVGHADGPRVAAKRSMHEYGLAADFGYRGGAHGKAQFYRDLAKAARSVGLESGMDYNDPCHICIPREQFFAGLAEGIFHRVVPEAAWKMLAEATTRHSPLLARNSAGRRHRPKLFAQRTEPHLRLAS